MQGRLQGQQQQQHGMPGLMQRLGARGHGGGARKRRKTYPCGSFTAGVAWAACSEGGGLHIGKARGCQGGPGRTFRDVVSREGSFVPKLPVLALQYLFNVPLMQGACPEYYTFTCSCSFSYACWLV
jgi:hypothetical protein